MNHIFFRFSFAVIVIACLLSLADAQQRNTTKRKAVTKKAKTTTVANPFGTSGTTGNIQNVTNNASSSTTDPFGNNTSGNTQTPTKQDTVIKKEQQSIPYEYAVEPSSGNPLTDSVKPSLRNDNGVDESYIKDQTPLVYDNIREDDAIFKQRIWSVIDTREKLNLPFRNPRVEDNGSQLFFAILYRAVTEGGITAFKDERFTEPISKEKFLSEYAGGYDTLPFRGDLQNPDKITKYQIRRIEFPVDSVYKFMVKEDVIFDKESSTLVRRIIGIAPMTPTLIKGRIVEAVGNEAYPRFWIYYPDIRPILAKYRVYNAKNFAANMSWDDLFQAHMYSSYIVKSTLNNYRNLTLKEYFKDKDPIFQLLEGEKIKEKIFNYEQDLWQY